MRRCGLALIQICMWRRHPVLLPPVAENDCECKMTAPRQTECARCVGQSLRSDQASDPPGAAGCQSSAHLAVDSRCLGPPLKILVRGNGPLRHGYTKASDRDVAECHDALLGRCSTSACAPSTGESPPASASQCPYLRNEPPHQALAALVLARGSTVCVR